MDDIRELMSADISDSLMRLMGLNRWVLDLGGNVLHIEYGNKLAEPEHLDVPLTDLENLYTPDEMARVAEHWREAAAKGLSGPVVLPFVRRDGSKVQIESVASLRRRPSGQYLVGIYKTVEDYLKLQKKARLLGEFLDSFVKNSPSAVMVFDPSHRVISASEALGRFLHLDNVRPLIGHTVDHMEKMFEAKLLSIIKASLTLPTPSKGRHVTTVEQGLHQSIYWRCFPLGVDQDETPPKVFAFDLHAAGPTTLVN
jgi:PAS domain-containing protein